MEERLERYGVAGRTYPEAGRHAVQMLAYWPLVLGLCVWLATRRIGTTFDDANYLNYFRPFDLQRFGAFEYFIEEPGWRLLTTALGSALDPVSAYRLILFVSPLAFMASLNKIVGGRWRAVGAHSWLILAAVLIDHQIGSMHFIAAIRQGLAISVFALLLAVGMPSPLVRPLAPALVAASIHTAMLVVAAVLTLVHFLRRRRRWALAIAAGMAAYAIGLSVGLLPSIFSDLDLGRRTTTYVYAQTINWRSVALLAGQMGTTLFLLQASRTPWFMATVVLVPTAIALSLANAGAIRILLTVHVFMLIVLAQSIRTTRGQIAAAFWFASCIAWQLWEGAKDTLGLSSWLGLWELTLRR